MKITTLIAIATFSFSLSLLAQEPGDGPIVYTNPNECLDDLMPILGRSYKVLSKDVIVQLSKDGTLDVYRSNYKISKALPNGQCFDDSKHILRGYNTVLINAYTKAKMQCDLAVKKAGGPDKPVRSSSCDAMIACDNQNKTQSTDWYNEATKLVPNLQHGPPPATAP